MKLFLREKSSDRVILLWCIYCIAEIVSNKAKGWISKRVFQENKAPQIFRKTNISYALIHAHTCAYQGVRNVCFSENLTWFVFFFETAVLGFALLPYYWRNEGSTWEEIHSLLWSDDHKVRHWSLDPGVLGSKPHGGSNVHLDFHTYEVNQMSAGYSWGLKRTYSSCRGFLPLRQLNPIHEKRI